jgi:hypothetical protein
MTWGTWRFQRIELLLLGLLMLGGIGFFTATRTEVRTLFQPEFFATCGLQSENGVCRGPSILFEIGNGLLRWMVLLPLAFALLLTAPLVNELSNGNYRLAWTQGLSRERWLALRLLAIVALGLLCAVATTLVYRWWASPGEPGYGEYLWDHYDRNGTVLVGETFFAVALLLAAGVLVRHTLPAIFIGTLLYGAVKLTMLDWLRPGLVQPKQIQLPGFQSVGTSPVEWYQSTRWIDGTGARVPDQRLFLELCRGETFDQNQYETLMNKCLADNQISQVMSIHPASHYWPMQLIESGLYVAAGLGLLWFTVWYVLRRVE